LKQLARDKEELLGILAHDLKNHLGGVVMSAEILRDRVAARDPADSGAARLVGNIAETSSQLLRFLKEFLANAAVDHETSVRWTTVDLAEAVNAAVARCRTAAECKGILVRESLPEGRVEVRADLTGVGQVLDNVLSNALKFSPPVQSVVVSLVSEADGGVVTVRDQGPGFTEEDRARLFGRYTRLSARPTAGEPSTGLGLSIVRKLMLAMGGEVRCENHPDGGAMVTLRFSRPPDP
ncbi:MAG: HAMP domain-containing histidine kinase, partial [Nitrospira sp.]|nr:HAMP domain-containing histidine kinase [Nitrospira sp.]